LCGNQSVKRQTRKSSPSLMFLRRILTLKRWVDSGGRRADLLGLQNYRQSESVRLPRKPLRFVGRGNRDERQGD